MFRPLDEMKSFRQTSFLVLFTVVLLIWRYSVASAAVNDPVAELDAFITRTLKEYQVPGVAVAVVRDGRVSLVKGYGVRNVTEPSAVDENTICARESHTFAVIAGLRLDTTPYDRYTSKWAPRWQTVYRPPRGFEAKHPVEL